MSQFDIKKFKNILVMEQPELHYFLRGKLDDLYPRKDLYTDDKNFIYVKGDIPVLVLAHLDTVHFNKPTHSSIYYDPSKGVMWSPDGIGGDDRCGVHSILSILEKGFRPHVLFSWDEEIGCVGSSEFSKTVEGMFGSPVQDALSEINFAIQFDRKGFSESVYYDLDNKDFEEYINSFGFETNIGSFTDIAVVCPEFGFAGVNISAGYINEHTTSETIFIDEMLASERKVIDILKDQIENSTHYEYKENTSGYYSYDSGWGSSYGSYYKGGYHSSKSYGFDDYEETKDLSYYDSDDETFMPTEEYVTCEFCYAEKGNVPWDDTDDPVLGKLCNECRASYPYDPHA